MNSKILIITGMHRSGTSLVSEYLVNCGLFLGNTLLDSKPDQLGPYGGHHEDIDFLNFHSEILKKMGKSNLFNRTLKFGFPTKDFQLSVKSSDVSRAVELIESRSNMHQWGWKDPRSTLFLDFWNDHINYPKYLFLIRNPFSVVSSLVRRKKNKFIMKNPIIGLKTWIVFNKKIIDFYIRHQESCLVLDIDDIILNKVSLINLLSEKFDIHLEFKSLEYIINAKAFQLGNDKSWSEAIRMKNKYSKEMIDSYFIYEKLRSFCCN